MKKNIFIILIFVAVLGIYYFFQQNYFLNKDFQKNNEKTLDTQTNYVSSASSSSSSSSGLSVKEAKKPVDILPADARDAIDWMTSNGRFSKKEREDYQYYDDKTLEALGENGDVKALTLLGDRYLTLYRDYDKAAIYYEAAAVRGSVSAIAALSIIKSPNSLQTPDERHASLLEVIAYVRSIGLRGDHQLSKLQFDTTVQSYETVFKEQVKFSEEDEQIMNERANQIIQQWNSKRREFGLSEFDNSSPAIVNKLH